ncbi:ArsR family transcriptional regulator [Candidatus Nitrososphaera gargensis]|nr:ArsR family transcriptional regulator [Candidatus Nitrososphaera gargensis]
MFPEKLKKAIQLLGDDVNWKIVELLADRGKVTWQELLDGSGAVHAKTLNFQLKELIGVGLVDRYEVGRSLEGNTGILSFDLSPWGKDIVRGLQSALNTKQNE